MSMISLRITLVVVENIRVVDLAFISLVFDSYRLLIHLFLRA